MGGIVPMPRSRPALVVAALALLALAVLNIWLWPGGRTGEQSAEPGPPNAGAERALAARESSAASGGGAPRRMSADGPASRNAGNGNIENAGRIRGIVKNERGESVSNAIVVAITAKEKSWRDAEFMRRTSPAKSERTATTGASGEFIFNNLENNCEYKLFAKPNENILFDFRPENFDAGESVTTPADDCVIILAASGLDLELIPPPDAADMFDGGRTISGEILYQLEREGRTSHGDYMGELKRHMTVAALPGTQISLLLRTRYKPVDLRNIMISGGSGMERVKAPLTAWNGNSLTISLRDADGRILTRAQVTDITYRSRMGALESQYVSLRHSPSGEFILQNLPSRAEIEIVPAATSFCAPKRISLQISDEGPNRSNVVLDRGGVLRIRTLNSREGSWAPQLYKSGDENDTDKAIPYMLDSNEPFANSIILSGSDYLLNRALEPGSYVLVAYREKKPRADFTIRAGEETVIDVDLGK